MKYAANYGAAERYDDSLSQVNNSRVAGSGILECDDVSTPARLPRRGPRLSSLWTLRLVAARVSEEVSLMKCGGEPPRAKAVTGHRTPN
jgi:hypothetical protein